MSVVLVDTSIWIEYLERNNEFVEQEVDDLLRRDEVATAGLVLAELRHGCRTGAQVRAFLAALEPVNYLETDRANWLRAGEIAAEGAIRGYRLEVGDCLLAALVFREGCSIFTLDRDFERIPGLKLYRARVN